MSTPLKGFNIIYGYEPKLHLKNRVSIALSDEVAVSKLCSSKVCNSSVVCERAHLSVNMPLIYPSLLCPGTVKPCCMFFLSLV